MHGLTIESILSVLIFGAILLAFIYHVVLYIFSKDKLLLHYLWYILFSGIFVFSRTGFIAYWFGPAVENYLYNYLNEPIQIVYLALYFNFILQSVEVTQSKNSFLYRSWIFIMIILIGYAVVFFILRSIIHFRQYPIAFIAIRLFIFGLTSVMLWQCFKLRHITFQLFILIGCSLYFVFGLISFISNSFFTDTMPIYPPEWLMIGSFVDIVFFSMAMSYRNKKQWESMNLALLKEANEIIEIQKVVLEKQKALENERNRIATDMHDDLGSGLTKITYLSQMALNDSNAKENLAKINKTSADLVENMSEIIWAMKQENNTIEDLITYIKIYAVEYLEATELDFTITIPTEFDRIVVKGDNRRSVFLLVKEGLHNIIKHACATQVLIDIKIDKALYIKIKDNGIGCHVSPSLHSNGIKNMKKRINQLQGKFEMVNDDGTCLAFEIPIENLSR